MSAWERELDELRREALRSPAAPPPVDGPETEYPLEAVAMENAGKVPRRVVRGWLVLCSFTSPGPQTPGFWNLSAALDPAGRGSTDEDWATLGRIIKYMGAPPDPLWWPQDPNAPIHWAWTDDPNKKAAN